MAEAHSRDFEPLRRRALMVGVAALALGVVGAMMNRAAFFQRMKRPCTPDPPQQFCRARVFPLSSGPPQCASRVSRQARKCMGELQPAQAPRHRSPMARHVN